MRKVRLILSVISAISMLGGLSSCKPQEELSATKGLFFDQSATNIAVLFTGTAESGRLPNLNRMKAIFEDGKLGFKVEAHHNVTLEKIYEVTQSAAKRVGENGTLLFYMNTHGGGRPYGLETQSKSLRYNNVLDKIAEVRKVKRLITFIDSCHSEGAIEDYFNSQGESLNLPQDRAYSDSLGLEEMLDYHSNATRAETGFFSTEQEGYSLADGESKSMMDYGYRAGAYEQALVISSSTRSQLSSRPKFSTSLGRAMSKLRAMLTSKVTVADFIRSLATSFGNSGQRPRYKALPDKSILKEQLFVSAEVPSVADIFLYLGEPAEQNSAPIHISVPATATKALICLGDVETCTATPTAAVEMSAEPKIVGDRKVFSGMTNLSIQEGVKYTLMILDQSGKPTTSQAINFVPNS